MTEDTPQLTSRELQALSTRAIIIDVAEEIFLHDGFAGSSLGGIATAAKVSKGLILHHFGSKEALWAAVRVRHQDETRAAIQELLPEPPQSIDNVCQLFTAYFHFLEQQPQHLQFLLQACAVQPGELEPGEDAAAAVLIPWLQTAQECGVLRADLSPLALYVACTGLARAWHGGRHALPGAPVEEVCQQLLRIVMQGMIPTESP